MQRPFRIHAWQASMALCAMASTLSAHLQFFTAYALFKPLTMVLAMVAVWQWADRQRHPKATHWLLAGLCLSMLGDVCLLTDGAFLPGLIAFLCAHVCYIVLFRRDRPWSPAAWGCAAFLLGSIGGFTYLYLYRHGLPAAMRWPVAAYVFVIGLMVAQALARAITLRTGAAWCVACGAMSFMVSDTVLALNKFVAPVPAAQLAILSTYYLAQWLIVHGMLQVLRRTPASTNHSYTP